MRIAAFYHLLIALGALTLFCAKTYALDVNSVRFGVHNDKIRVVLDLSELSDFRAFMLADPYRMVIDLPNFDWDADRIQRPKESMVSGIRKGALTQDISRIVLDLETPALIQSAFMLPAQGEKANRLVIDYTKTTQSNFMAQKGIIHGTLDTQNLLTTDEAIQNTAPIVTAGGIPLPPSNNARPSSAASGGFKKDKPLIIIDPGHGGVDPGAIGSNKVMEKNVVLALSKQLRDQLLASGKYRVKLTREDDTFIRLSDRVAFARKHQGDLFISIHADSIKKSNVRGTSVYTLSKKASDAQTAKLAEKENRADLIAGIDLNVEDQQVAFILGDFLMTDTMNQSTFFANTLVSKLSAYNIRTLETPHRYAGFAVLKAPDIPSVLIETGFMSNREEAYLLNQPAHRKKVSTAIQSGIDSYFEHVQNNDN